MSRASRWKGLLAAVPWFASGIVLLCGLSLVADQHSLIWPGEDLRLIYQSGMVRRNLPILALVGLVAAQFLITGPRVTLSRSLVDLLPLPVLCLLLLSVWIMSGSLYARSLDPNTETFFAAGAAMLAAPLMYWSLLMSNDRERFVRFVWIALGIASVPIMASSVMKLTGNDGAFVEYFPVPFAAGMLAWFTWRKAMVRATVGVVLAGLCILSLKKTGVVAFGCLALPVVIDLVVRKWGVGPRTWALLGVGMVAIGGMATGLMELLEESFRSGEKGFRQYSFEIAWKQFLDSPIYGQLYAGSSAIKNPYVSIGWVAVHNDILDVMRQGGVIAAGLFAIGYSGAWTALVKFRRHWESAPSVLLACAAMQCGFIGLFLFNPVLLGIDCGSIVWMMVGIGLFQVRLFAQRLREQEISAWQRR